MIDEIKDFVEKASPVANHNAIITGDGYRFTILTDSLIRMEYNAKNIFNDNPTQMVINRVFDVPEYRVIDDAYHLEIITASLHLFYDKKEFSPEGLFITLEKGYGVYGSTWNYGEAIVSLKGTARTLDNADGEICLDDGLLSRNGYVILDDSKSAILDEDGWVQPRSAKGLDLYFLGYGHDYMRCLRDFYHLSGATPLLPRYTLGNWWSRFYPYTQKEYLELMDRFLLEEIPMAVSVIDMDWHKTAIPEKYGSGWTGYSWNRDLFPEPTSFLRELHERKLKTTLNLHPADGVKGHEDNYLPMAMEMGVDFENEERIPFDVTDKKYMDCYFKHMHHPLEDDGVDFWWIDWQQGTTTRTPGIDPLWMLNHLHYLDHGRDGKRALTFSRYAGIGSHRYPIGFSGDTVSSWDSLDFQPYFTATASNAGYTWWSHDIGGHQQGKKDDELVTRWIQYGVFSPIMRLHSTSNPFYGKEPWNYGPKAEGVMKDYLRLRHKLIPYLYTANYRTHLFGEPLIKPMYYKWDRQEAYEVKNQYQFGPSMIVCPITEKAKEHLHLGKVNAWLPEGKYYDFFRHTIYEGGRKLCLYRGLEEIPVLVPAGSIIPMTEEIMDSHVQNPVRLELMVFHGESGEYTMIEDDCREMNSSNDISYSAFRYQCGDTVSLTFEQTNEGDSVIPKDREYEISIIGIAEPVKVISDCDMKYSYLESKKELIVEVTGHDLSSFAVEITPACIKAKQQDVEQQAYHLLNDMEISYDLKADIFRIMKSEQSVEMKASQLFAAVEDHDLYGAMLELLTAFEE